MKYRMWTTAEPASQGQDSGAGADKKGASASAIRPEPVATAMVSSRLSSLALTSAFQTACSSAAPSTASVTGSEISMLALADHLLDEGRHALHSGASFLDRFLGTVEIHGREVGQQRRQQHVGGISRQAAACYAHLNDVERGHEHVEDRGHRRFLLLHLTLHPARAQSLQPSWNFARRDFAVPAAGTVRAELAPV